MAGLNGNVKMKRKTGQVNISNLDTIMNVACIPIEFEGGGRAIFQDWFQEMCRKTTELSVKISGSPVDNR